MQNVYPFPIDTGGVPVDAQPVDDAADIFLASLTSAASLPELPDYLTASIEADAPLAWPVPQPIVSELLPVAPLTAALLPEPLAASVFDEARRMPCPPDFIAAASIVALGAVIGARCAVRPKRQDDGWIVTPNLWGGIVGQPSAKKSPAISAATRELDRLEAEEADKAAGKMATYLAEKAAHDAFKKALEKVMQRAVSEEGEPQERDRQLAAAKRDLAALAAPEAPYQRRFKLNDATVEKVGDLLTTNPAGLLVLRDELTGLLASWDKSGHEGDRAFYLESWNGTQSFSIDRIGRGSLFVRHLCLSVFGGIQPDLLGQYLAGVIHALDNDGRLQRFQVMVFPDPVDWDWRDQAPSLKARTDMRAVFEHLATFDPVMDGARPANEFVALPTFSFDDAAQQVFIDWCAELHGRIAQETNPVVAQHLAKYEKLFCSVALIFHLVAGQVGDINERTAVQAAGYCAYLETHARRIYAITETATVTAAQTLGRRLSEGKLADGFTVRDLLRKRWGGLTNPKAVDAALHLLEEAGWIRAVAHHGGQGRSTTRYHISPQVRSSAQETQS